VLAYGEESAGRFLSLVARNGPQLAGSDAEVRARVSSGEAAFGLASSIEGAAAAASAAPLDVVYPDQVGSGAIALPTAVALLGGASDGARAVAAWLAGPDAERILVARIPGLLPLRPEVPIPVGVEPAGNLVTRRSTGTRSPPEPSGSSGGSRGGRRVSRSASGAGEGSSRVGSVTNARLPLRPGPRFASTHPRTFTASGPQSAAAPHAATPTLCMDVSCSEEPP
jgi:hypothetical protein